MADKTNTKEYSLKSIETQLLNVLNQQHANLLSNTLSFIVIERLAIQVTDKTRFDLNQDMTTVTITEIAPEPTEGDVITEAPAKEKK